MTQTTINQQSLAYWLLFHHAPKAPHSKILKLLEIYKTPQTLCKQSFQQLRKLGLHQTCSHYIKSTPLSTFSPLLSWQKQDQHHHIISIQDPSYPSRLKNIPEPPLVLYVHGNPNILNMPQIAIVGSRNPTPTGKEIAKIFAYQLTRANLVITSGLAIGIDKAAHIGAITNPAGKTIAVLGNGIDYLYPWQNKKLAAKIKENGAIISEFSPKSPPKPWHFPVRNRLISGLTLGTLVIEAKEKSGSLITAYHAANQGREVFAIPGSILNPNSIGCHLLIQQGAKLTHGITDILEELPEYPNKPTFAKNEANHQLSLREPHESLENDHRKLLECIGFEVTPMDKVIGRSGYSANRAASILLNLELHGYISSIPGGYIRAKQ